ADGLVTSFNRPGGNVTGLYVLTNALVAKQLELLRELAPTATTIAFLDNPTSSAFESRLREMQEAALALGLKLHILRASTERELDIAFASVVERRAGALVVAADPFLT